MMECYFKVSCPGCYGSSHDTYELEQVEAKARSKEINRNIKKEAKLIKKQVKILLLGAGESGKTTFLKQMRILHDNGFTEDQVKQYKQIIFKNIVQGMRVLCDARNKLVSYDASLEFQNPNEYTEYSKLLLSLAVAYYEEEFFLGIAPKIKELWADQGIQNTYKLKSRLQISESIKYFYDSLDRIAVQGYVPSELDILNARSATQGVSETPMLINNIPFLFIDVGGQRSERNKWADCFENVTSVVFLVASSEFDQTILEDRQTNRLEESMRVFDTIVNKRAFEKTSIILFINKIDLLKEKIKKVNLSDYFPEFTGDNRNFDEVKAFILKLFQDLRRKPNSCSSNYDGVKHFSQLRGDNNGGIDNSISIHKSRTELYPHYTIAIDTENIRLIFNDVKKIILNKNLQSLMLQ